METRTQLVIAAIEQARQKQQENIIVTDHDNGYRTVTEFYKKGFAIWCRMTTGNIITDSRVYKVNSDSPYIRNMGGYWYLGEPEKKIIKNIMSGG